MCSFEVVVRRDISKCREKRRGRDTSSPNFGKVEPFCPGWHMDRTAKVHGWFITEAGKRVAAKIWHGITALMSKCTSLEVARVHTYHWQPLT